MSARSTLIFLRRSFCDGRFFTSQPSGRMIRAFWCSRNCTGQWLRRCTARSAENRTGGYHNRCVGTVRTDTQIPRRILLVVSRRTWPGLHRPSALVASSCLFSEFQCTLRRDTLRIINRLSIHSWQLPRNTRPTSRRYWWYLRLPGSVLGFQAIRPDGSGSDGLMCLWIGPL